VILIVGIMWPILSRMGLGRLPGDIVFQRDGAAFYFPIVVGSAVFWWLSR